MAVGKYLRSSAAGATGGIATLGQDGKVPSAQLPAGGGEGGPVEWDDVQNKPSEFPPESHAHAISDVTDLQTSLDGKAAAIHNHLGTYEPADAAIQTHLAAAHAPSDAQKNSDILKSEIEAVLTGEISSHSHAGGGGGGPTKLTGSSGAFAGDTTWLTLTANTANVTSATQTVVMTVTGLGAGTYRVKAALVFQAAATSTGIGITLNHTGTVTRYVANWMHVTTGGAAATGISDQATTTAAGQMMEGKAERVKDTRSSFTVGVDSANADQLAVLDAVIIVTASGDLQVKIATEVNASAVRLMAGSTLEVHKTV